MTGTRIGVITDAHANLPATVAALTAMDEIGCERIIHLGDAIGIGPHPREVLELLLTRDNILLLMGNHDEWFARGLPDPQPSWMSEGELVHQRWTHAQLNPEWRELVAAWPMIFDEAIGDLTIRFQHYAINNGGFGPISRDNVPAELDSAFAPTTDVVFFGHHHPQADVIGKARYINPGALGCHPSLGARFAVIACDEHGKATISLHSIPYEPSSVMRDMVERNVPEAAFILRTFLG